MTRRFEEGELVKMVEPPSGYSVGATAIFTVLHAAFDYVEVRSGTYEGCLAARRFVRLSPLEQLAAEAE